MNQINTPDWLMARPIAHRGLHARAKGIIENSRSAADAAIAGGYSIECDVQPSADGEAMVFHDDTLDRLTPESGHIWRKTSAELAGIVMRDSSDTILPLPDFLARIAGRTPLVIEIKSMFDGKIELAERTANLVSQTKAPIGIKSFDPAIIAHLRKHGARLSIAHVPLGIIAQASYNEADWPKGAHENGRALASLLHLGETKPDFLSYAARDLPHAAAHLCRFALGMPVMTWTIRSAEAAQAARPFADQIVFEGFVP